MIIVRAAVTFMACRLHDMGGAMLNDGLHQIHHLVVPVLRNRRSWHSVSIFVAREVRSIDIDQVLDRRSAPVRMHCVPV